MTGITVAISAVVEGGKQLLAGLVVSVRVHGAWIAVEVDQHDLLESRSHERSLGLTYGQNFVEGQATNVKNATVSRMEAPETINETTPVIRFSRIWA